jgi:ABC-2 type transport system permease protein
VLCGLALALGWEPAGRPAAALLLVVVGTAAFAALGFLMAGTLRAEATLAAANLVYLLLLVGGGVVVPLDRFPDAVRPAVELLPSGALAEGLRDAVGADASFPGTAVLVLAAWAAVTGAAAARTFRWE